ncbi:DUF1573 domain-containing protein [Parabacteroides acidifaciens]|uniref:DUF1573 domain-containing protein n=1 Tax=Parabacteroides acidifaciens TaxID=2290935 RepID=A0A3D8HB32_9BACT|nr:DUF1573 domain-containing protein [Parabacteroides acidifaciens]MBC8603074.1 DUF1573 domain-containing protein [Parabacteroides acidifaciens]RDU48196.1 DUF1573 domain-containing protein [Parabacteroides acidifaciens]
MKQQLLYILSLLFLLAACQENKKEQFARLVQEWQGKEIVFPQDMLFTRFVTDTVDYTIQESEYKVLIYVDSTGCTSCKLQLPKWKELIAHVDSATNGNIPFIFVFQSKDDKELRYILKRDNFTRPVCIDRDSRLDKLNRFPQEITFQTFLLDKDNKVKVIGNPVHNLAVKDLYLKQITGIQDKEVLPTTTLEPEKSEYDFGTVKEGTIKKQIVTVRNTGSSLFKLKGFTTSCDCTEATCDWKELQPGESGTITVSYEVEQPGDFYRTVDIYGNIPKALTLSFIGTVN